MWPNGENKAVRSADEQLLGTPPTNSRRSSGFDLSPGSTFSLSSFAAFAALVPGGGFARFRSTARPPIHSSLAAPDFNNPSSNSTLRKSTKPKHLLLPCASLRMSTDNMSFA